MHDRFRQVCATHKRSQFLTVKNPRYAREVIAYTAAALQKDLGSKGDITSRLILDPKLTTTAILLSKDEGLLAGVQELRFFLGLKNGQLGKVRVSFLKKDGDHLKKNDIIATLQGYACDILALERTALNLLQRMSGIATYTAAYVAKVPTHVLIVPTRKTLWGLLDKRACVLGGGGTHRLSLDDAILLKDTHLALVGHNMPYLFTHLKKLPLSLPFIEIEVESIDDALQAVILYQKTLGKTHPRLPFYLMLDNMSPTLLKKAVKSLKKQSLSGFIGLEASGGIHLHNIQKYAATGVDILSIGALTHSAPNFDISLKINPRS